MTIPSAKSVKIKFDGVDYIRIGSSKKKLSKFPEYEIRLNNILLNVYPTIVNMQAPDYAQELTFQKLFVYYASKGIILREDSFEKTLKLKTKDGLYNIMAYYQIKIVYQCEYLCLVELIKRHHYTLSKSLEILVCFIL